MRKTSVLAAISALALTAALTACSVTSDTGSTPPRSDDMSNSDSGSDATASRSGEFSGRGDQMVEGTVTVSEDELVLSGFSSSEGPDLHIYLTNGDDEAAVEAGMEISTVAFDQASQTISLGGIDASGFDTVVIHCDKAKAVFGAAELS
jgi:hypothetical protein